MRTRILLTLLTILAGPILRGNMASPILSGTLGGQTFINRNVDVLREEIKIKPDRSFESALINVNYRIRSDSNGVSIPLVFHAKGYGEEMRISFDGKEIKPHEYFPADYSHLKILGLDSLYNAITIKWDHDYYFHAEVEDLKYFEIDIAPGIHEIQVSYTADAWIDRSDWVKKRSLYYALKPISFWKSYGEIEVELDYAEIPANLHEVSNNLGPDYEDDTINKKRVWVLQEVKDDFIELEFTPRISVLSELLIKVSPSGIASIVGIILIMLHFWLIHYSKDQSRHIRNWIVFVGAASVSFLIYFVYLHAFAIIDYTLTEHASSFHGYTFLTIIFVPFGIILHAFIANWYKRALSE